MKVALFLSRGVNPESGGSYSFERDLLLSLAQIEIDCGHNFFIFGWDSVPPKEIQNAPHIKYIQCFSFFRAAKILYGMLPRFIKTEKLKNSGKTFANSIFERRTITKKLLENQIDLTWSLGLNCPTFELPYVITVWDLQHRLQPYFPELREWNSHEQYYLETIGRASYIVTGTDAGKKEVQQFYQVPSERIKVIPFATPSFALTSAQQDKLQIFRKYEVPDFFLDSYLFYPAQFWPHKNHANLLLAIRFLRDNFGLIFPLILTGSDQGNLSYVKQMVRDLDLSEQVHFLGFISQLDLVSFYKYAFALTFVSLYGPDNLPPLEAFALGCPVIASNVPGAEEQLSGAALLVDSKEPKEIAVAIKSLKENPDLRHTLIQNGTTRAKQWTGPDYVREICSIFDEFVSVRRCWSSSEAFNFDG
jgi:glycosyltransferase involved in cell wall biosynthesis